MRKERIIALLAAAAACFFAASCRSAETEAPVVSLAHIYTESLGKAATPVVTADDKGVVEITSGTEGAVIYYTVDGNDPTTASTRYEGPITDLAPGEYTIRAIAVAEGYEDSDIGEGRAVIPEPQQVATPVITVNENGSVEITSDTDGAVIYYTTDGSEPTRESTRYEGPLTNLGSGEHTIRAIAVAEGYLDSDIAEENVNVPVLVVVVRNLHFVADSPELLDEDKGRIADIADAIKEVLDRGREYEILVEGHAAAVKTPEGQQILSEQRAESIAEQLAENGIDSSLIVTRGYGGTRPVADNDTEEGRAQNRRVVITVTPKEE